MRRGARSDGVALVVIALTAVLAPGIAQGGTPFVHETVNVVLGQCEWPSLALDAHGSPCISYLDLNSADLVYANKSNGAWTIEIVDAAGAVGWCTSLALDAQGNPHISYHDVTNRDLKYASKSGGAWTIETVDVAGYVGEYTSLALDVQGNPRISYHDATNSNLKYASKSGGAWTIEHVGEGAAGNQNSLALDAQGNPHISYYDFYSTNLKYASKSGGAWTRETVDAVGYGVGTSLALDAQGNPRISYYDGLIYDLKYASKSGSAWTIETVDVAGGMYPALALDAQGNPRISYFDATNSNLKYASKSGGAWTIETVDAAGRYTSLALDAQGNPRISYYDSSSRNLKYTDSAVHLTSPVGGGNWPVGGWRTIEWAGAGTVGILLSVDGGASYVPLEEGLMFGPLTIRVPHSPTKFARIRVLRDIPFSKSDSDSFFTISAEIILQSFKTQPPSQLTSGVELTWKTEPGPEDLSGYKLERRAEGGNWTPLVSLTRETSYQDPQGGPGTHYRLFGVNGWGEPFYLGETSVAIPVRPLAAWPLPYRQGDLQVAFQSASGLGGVDGRASVRLYDLQGKLVRTLADDRYPAGVHQIAWDGRDEQGQPVATGIYMLKLVAGVDSRSLKVVVMR